MEDFSLIIATLIPMPTSLIGWVSHILVLIGAIALLLNLIKMYVYFSKSDTLADFLGLDGNIEQEVNNIKKHLSEAEKMNDWDIRSLAYDKYLSKSKQALPSIIVFIFLTVIVKILF